MSLPDLADLDLSEFTAAERVVVEEFLRRKKLQKKGDTFLDFVKHVMPGTEFVVEEVHVLIARHLEMLKAREIDRLMVLMPPRTGKSLTTSELLPAWWEGHFPGDKVLHASYASTLVEKFGRKIRNLIMSDAYREIFPDTEVAKDSRASAQWGTTKKGEYNAVGVGGGVAGKGGNLLLIDDPVSEQDMFSKSAHDATYEWYGSGYYTRRQPDRNAILITMCMTGDTSVLMADGTEKPLRDIRTNDEVATYDNKNLATTRVTNQKTNGLDTIFTVRTRSGKILRANERHPFLVDNEGVRTWKRLKDLTLGENLVSLRGAVDLPDQRLPRGCATHVVQKKRTIKNTLRLLINQWGTMVSGKTSCAVGEDATNLLRPKDSVTGTTVLIGGTQARSARLLNKDGISGSKIGTELRNKISTVFSKSKEAFARCVGNLLPQRTLALTGTISSVSTTVTIPMWYAGSCATIATSRSGMQKLQQQPKQWQDTSDFTTDEIVSIAEGGREEVFDVEIERTENFIANGVVSHNTRWRQDDLCGRLIADSITKPDADQWTVLKIPAIIDQETADMLNSCSDDPHIDVPHYYRPGDSFSPRRWPLHELMRTKNTISRKGWASLYQQSPTEEGGNIIQSEWWKAWPANKPLPKIEYILQAYDTAFEEGETNDFSARVTLGVFKRDSDNRMCVFLLERLKERLSFPNLLAEGLASYNEYQPDRIIVEKAASGIPLIQEMRKRGMPVTPIPPKGSKVARANAASILFEQGAVYYPDGKQWAQDVIDDCAAFPNGAHDDIPDAMFHGLNFIRRLFLLETPADDEDDEEDSPIDKPIVRSYAKRQSRLRIAA